MACVAEGAGRYIIIGTFHGANVLDKRDYSIRPLPDVDDKRVDDILVSRNGHWWLTANKKLYEYAPEGELLNVYPGGEKYIFRLDEDAFGRILCTEWEGGQLRLEDGRLVRISDVWPDAGGFVRTATDRQGRRLITDIFGNCYAEADGEPWTNMSLFRTAIWLDGFTSGCRSDRDWIPESRSGGTAFPISE